MKKIILFFLLISYISFAEDCSWKWNQPLPQGNQLNEVKFASKNVVYIFSKNFGSIMKSTDSGLNWKIINTGVSKYYQTFVFDENNVMLQLPQKKMLRTSDGGQSWFEQTFNLTSLSGAYYQFIDINNGFYFSQTDSIFQKTTDGGQTWEKLSLPSKSIYRSFCFVNENTYFTAEQNTFMKTTDGGKNWSASNILNEPYNNYSIFFVDENTGWISSINSYLIKTTDGGDTWSKQRIIATMPVSYFKFFDENLGYIFGDGYLYRTTNGGEKWKAQFGGPTFDEVIKSIDIYEDGFLIGVGGYGNIKRTTDFGYTWENQKKGVDNSFYEVNFYNENNGLAIGGGGIIIKTTDGGENWVRKINGIIQHYLDYIKYINVDTIIIAEREGNFYKSTNGGDEWFKTGTISDVKLYGVCFISEQVGWVAYYSTINEYFINKTTDGGETWFYQLGTKDTLIYSLQFVNENTGFAVGAKGTFRKTTDGGENWNVKNIGNTKTINCLYFIDENTGWIFNEYQILKTTDAGNSWSVQKDSIFSIVEIKFINENLGYAVSSSGSIFHTTNGGDEWNYMNSCTNNQLHSICMIDENTGWAVGNSGTILEYSCSSSDIEEHLPISENNDFQIFPNPATNELTLSIPEGKNINSISIFNSLGIEIKRIEQTEIIGNNKITISTMDLPSGLYHCSFVNQSGRVTKSFVVVR